LLNEVLNEVQRLMTDRYLILKVADFADDPGLRLTSRYGSGF